MSIVRLALRHSYTFMVMAILILIIGGLSLVTKRTAILLCINIAMVGVIWTYKRVSADRMARRAFFVSECAMTTTVSNRAHSFGTAGHFLGRS